MMSSPEFAEFMLLMTASELCTDAGVFLVIHRVAAVLTLRIGNHMRIVRGWRLTAGVLGNQPRVFVVTVKEQIEGDGAERGQHDPAMQ